MPPSDDRQRIERVPGSRRARLTPVPGTDPEPEAAPVTEDAGPVPSKDTFPKGTSRKEEGPNDERLRRDVPPHY